MRPPDVRGVRGFDERVITAPGAYWRSRCYYWAAELRACRLDMQDCPADRKPTEKWTWVLDGFRHAWRQYREAQRGHQVII